MPDPTSPSADVSCRAAWADDASDVARIQVGAWAEALSPALAGALPDEGSVATLWRDTLTRPPDARHRVLVALDRARVVGFVLTGPATDDDADRAVDGEIAELTVDSRDRGAGHGSRLMAAAVDTLRADGFRRAVAWVEASDERLRTFFADAGWQPDGAHRVLEDDAGERSTEARLHVSLAD